MPPLSLWSDEQHSKMRNILNAVAFVANVFIMFGLGIFGMHVNGEVPASFPTLVTPVSWCRILWIIILLVEFGWVIIQLLPKYREEPLVTIVGWNFIGASICQICWSLFFSFQILSLSFISIVVMLVFLFLIFRAQSTIQTPSIKEYCMLKLPFSLLLSYMIVACIVDINVLAVAMGVSTTVQFYMAFISLTIMLIAAGSIMDLVVVLVIAWAMIGIIVELSNPDYLVTMMFTATQISAVKISTIVSLVLCLGIASWRLYGLWQESRNTKTEDTAMETTSSTDAANEGEGGNYTSMA